MASPQNNNMKFHKTGNAHLIKRHARSSSSALTRGIAKREQTKPTSDSFTMIFIDCDDTLIPSKLHRYLYKNLNIDIFKLYKRTMLKQFQYDIIYAIEAIRETFISQYNQDIKIAIVSNASSKWLNATINNKSHNAYFKILCSYFTDSGIEIKSAIEETFEFLCKKFGTKNKEKVNEMIAMSLNTNNPHHSKWMLKYTAYSSIINKYKRKLKKKCRTIVNIGDGETELEAIKHYSQTFGVGYMALKFIKNGTFNQLSYQWNYIRNKFWSVISDMDVDNIYNDNHKSVIVQTGSNINRNKKFKHKRNLSNQSNVSYTTTASNVSLNVFYFDYVLKNDNNEYFTGQSQLTAIRTYFQKWVRIHALNQETEKDKNAVLKWMCTRIHVKMSGNDPYTPYMISFKKIIKHGLCSDEAFKQAFDNYYKQVRQKLNMHNKNNKRRKSIDESKISEDVHISGNNKEHKLHRRSAIYKKGNGGGNGYIKDSSLISLVHVKSKSSVTSQGTMTTNSPYSNNSYDDHTMSIYYSDGDYMYFSPKSQDADEDNSSDPN